MTATEIRAAGGLVWRPTPGGGPDVEIAVIHRLRYDDWSLPKGKLDPHEHPLRAAVREVGEETGRSVTVGRALATVRYDVGNHAKAVQYWSMRDTGPLGDGVIADTDEVAGLEWLTPAAAVTRLSYDDDRRVLAAFTRSPRVTSVVLLVRHARAGRRSEWDGPDESRPLDPRGVRQAGALAELLGCFSPTAVVAADRLRCRQTVEPLAASLELEVGTVAAVSDEAYEADPSAAIAALAGFSVSESVTVVCSQGTAIPGLLEQWLPPRLRGTLHSLETRKAAWWAIGAAAGVPVWVDRYDRPAVSAGSAG